MAIIMDTQCPRKSFEDAPMAKLVIVSGASVGSEFTLKDDNVIGRQPDCSIVLAEESISRKHARVYCKDDRYFVQDLGSTNGTFVNGKLIEQAEIADRDVLTTGNFMFTFQATEQPPPSNIGQTILSFKQEDVRRPSRVLKVIDAQNYDLQSTISTFAEKDNIAVIQRRIATVNRIARTMATILDIDDILGQVLDDLFDVFSQAERGFIMLLDPDSGELVPKAVKTRNEKRTARIEVSRTILNAAMEGKKSILSADAAQDDRFKAGHSIVDLNIHCVMCAPILYQDELFGVVNLDTSQITGNFTQDDLSLLTAVAAQAAVVLANAQMHQRIMHQQRIEQDLRLAERVQRSFLPSRLPEVEGFAFKTYYTSAYEVGGDFYDVIEAAPDRISIVIGDVSGKGVSAALMMARIMSEVRSYAFRDLSPEEIVRAINASLEHSIEGQFITFFYASLDVRAGTVRFVNAGHLPPAVRRRDGTIQVIEEPSNLPLGIMEDISYEGDTFSLDPGDLVFLCTDGVIEAMNDIEDCYGTERMTAAIATSTSSPDDVINAIMLDVRDFAAGAQQSDDLTMVAFGRNPD